MNKRRILSRWKMKQVMFYDRENDTKHGGILMDNGDIICGCCGDLISADEIGERDGDVVILKVFNNWVNLDEEICGDEFVEGSFTALAYKDGGTIEVEDESVYDSEEEAVEFAKNRGWDEVVNDFTGEIVWKRS